MFSYALNDSDVKLWEPHKETIHAEFEDAIQNPKIIKVAWNSGFEQKVLHYLLGIDVPTNLFLDPSVWAKHLSMPGGLGQVGEILGLPEDQAKNKDGKRLIQKFCRPAYMGGEETLFGISEPSFRDWNTDPEDWNLFGEYCKQDTAAQRTILKILLKHPLPPSEFQNWLLDQKINERGLPVDMKLVAGAIEIAEKEKTRLMKVLKEITGLENPNSRDQLLGWAQKQGYPFSSLEKPMVRMAIEGTKISESCRQVLSLRRESAKTSDSKYQKIFNNVGSDGWLRNQFNFMGAARTGRWSGREVQVQNMPRPTKEFEKNSDRAVELLRAGDYETIRKEFTSVMDVISSGVRAAFRAPDGDKLVVADLSSIEYVVCGWLAGCKRVREVFEKGLDPYVSFGVDLFGTPYEILILDKEKRQLSKPGVLGGVFRLGGGEDIVQPNGEILRTGLRGYAYNQLGIDLSLELAHRSIRVFRETHPEIKKMWYEIEDASQKAFKKKKRVECGEHLEFDMKDGTLRMRLPSGRYLHYINPKVQERTFTYDGKPYTKDTLMYDGVDIKTKKWSEITTHGGKLTENATQAVARDVMINGVALADRRDMQICGLYHDEAAAVSRVENSLIELKTLIDCMSTAPKWAPDMLLGAKGFITQYYRKD